MVGAVQSNRRGLDVTLSNLASIGSLISGIAVLISLVYLAPQMRQTERNQRALITQSAITRATEFIGHSLDPVVAELQYRVAKGETAFSGAEIMQLRTLLRISVMSLADTDVQRKAGLIDEDTFEHSSTAVQGMLRQPIMRAIWKGSRLTYGTRMASMVDTLIESLPFATPLDLTEKLKSDLATVRRDDENQHADKAMAEETGAP